MRRDTTHKGDSHVKVKVEITMVLPQAKEYLGLPGAGRGKERPSLNVDTSFRVVARKTPRVNFSYFAYTQFGSFVMAATRIRYWAG